MVRALVAAVVAAAVATALAPAAAGAARPESLTITPSDTKPATTKLKYRSFKLVISGVVRVTDANGKPAGTYDALYCVERCGEGHPDDSRIRLTSKIKPGIPSTGGGLWDVSNLFQGTVPYNPKHRYELVFREADYGQLRFAIEKGCDTCTYDGAFSIRVEGVEAAKETVNLRVDFIVRASGPPNIPIAQAGSEPVASARVSGSGHATFTKKEGSRLVATETKGHFVHEHVGAQGTRKLELGIVSGTSYYPATKRLVLLLKVESSNDPACPEGGFLAGFRAAVLTLLPVTGEPDLGTAIFVGVPVRKTVFPGLSVEPCKGHAHGWQPGGGVSIRVVARESKGA